MITTEDINFSRLLVSLITKHTKSDITYQEIQKRIDEELKKQSYSPDGKEMEIK